MPATLTSRVELLLFDPLTNKPKHGERARITTQLWEEYLERIKGVDAVDGKLLTIPRLEDATYEFEGFTLSYTDLLSIIKAHYDRRHSSAS